MKEIDPEVAALLDDIPKPWLPKVLEQEGWGQHTVKQMRSAGKVPQAPKAEQAPKYLETCVQCGRPVTNARRGGGWWDHSGGTECDGALVEDQEFSDHMTEASLAEAREYQEALWRDRQHHLPDPHIQDIQRRLNQIAAQEKKQAAKRAAQRKAVREAPCSATKRQSACDHQCSQKGAHFGFHECKYCRHLWS